MSLGKLNEYAVIKYLNEIGKDGASITEISNNTHMARINVKSIVKKLVRNNTVNQRWGKNNNNSYSTWIFYSKMIE